MKKKGLIMAILLVMVAAVMGLAACNGKGGKGDDTTPVQYTVTFETNGGSTVSNSVTVEGGKSVDLPTPEKTYFNFVGWFDNADLYGEKLASPYTPTANITLYAKWEEAQYTVTFETNGGSTVSNSVTVEGGKSVALPTPEKTYFNFVGWFDNADLNGEKLASPYTPTANVTLYAKWEEAQYTVTFETNGGSTVSNSVTVEGGKSVALPTPEKTYFNFVGWFDNADLNGEKLVSPYTPTANITLYAKWEEILDTDEKYFAFDEIKDSSNTIIGYSVSLVSGLEKAPSRVFVPNSHNGKPVLTVKANGFANENIKDLIIPDSVTEIESGAFSGCNNLEKITLPFVGGYADGATHFGYVFGEDADWTVVPEKLRTVVVNGGIIGDYVFDQCYNITSLTIGSGVTSIGESAFSSCYKLIEVYNLSSLSIEAGADTHGAVALYAKDVYTSTSAVSKIITLNDYIFYDENGSHYLMEYIGTETHLTLPDSVTSVGNLAFFGRSDLTSVIIPDSVTSICIGAFGDCSGLTSVTIGSGVTSIGERAFQGCILLTSITIPNTVTSIGDYAFWRCSKLTSILIPNSVINLGKSAFYDCSSLTSVTIGSGVTSIGEWTFSGCIDLTSITIPNTVTSIGERAFSNCSGLTSLTIGSGVTSIGYSAFYGCIGLTSITVAAENTTYKSSGNCLVEIATNTLIAGCNTSVIPTDGSVTSIGYSAFYGCIGLTNITIPNTVTSIGELAFSDCSGLTSVTIPNTVISIGDFAFNNCSKLTSITFKGTKAQWEKISKAPSWAYNTPSNFTVICTGGTLSGKEVLEK